MTLLIKILLAYGVGLAVCLTASLAIAEETESTSRPALLGMPLILDARTRYESVQQDDIENTANALTFRVRTGVSSCSKCVHRFLAEIEGTTHLVYNFDSTINNKTDYPVVPDPKTLELNRLSWSSTFDGWTIGLGRQRMDLNNGRFLHGARFRQNEQTVDAVRVTSQNIGSLAVDYLYIWNFQTIFGSRSSIESLAANNHILNVSVDTSAVGTATAYLIAANMEDDPLFSRYTAGVRLEDTRTLSGPWEYDYLVEAARQTDLADNPEAFSFGYVHLIFGIKYEELSVSVGLEQLPGDGTSSFRASRGALHNFQGNADKFVATPPDGVIDTRFSIGYRSPTGDSAQGMQILGVYHEFEAEETDAVYGSEFDIVVIRELPGGFEAMLKYVKYDAKTWAADTQKLWFSLDWQN